MSQPRGCFMRQSFSFDDFDAFASAMNQGDVEHRLLNSAKFKASLVQVVSPDVMVAHHASNAKLLQTGTAVDGYVTFLVPGFIRFLWRDTELHPQRVGIIHGSKEHHSILPNTFQGIPVSLRAGLIAETLGWERLQEVKQWETMEIRPSIHQQLFQEIKSICYSREDYFNRNHEIQLKKVASLLLRSIRSFSGKSDRTIDHYQHITHRASEYLIHRLEFSDSLQEVCAHLGLSERTLRLAFSKSIAVSPKKYLKNLLLNVVRKELKANYPMFSITFIANQWGFWHMGQFSADYFKLFGELPSEIHAREAVNSPA